MAEEDLQNNTNKLLKTYNHYGHKTQEIYNDPNKSDFANKLIISNYIISLLTDKNALEYYYKNRYSG